MVREGKNIKVGGIGDLYRNIIIITIPVFVHYKHTFTQ